MDISIVIPLYNEEESLKELTLWIEKALQPHGYSYEIIFVDDGSNDDSWRIIEDIASQYQHIHAVKFRRNYGKSAALHNGFQLAKGKVVITMDADLQDNPEEIPALYDMIVNQGHDMVSGWKKKRYDPFSKTVPSKFFNWTARKVTGIRLHDFNCGLKAYRFDVVKSIEVYGEMHRYIPVLVKQAGFMNIGEKIVQHQARKYGTTKFGFERFINGFLDLLSIVFMTRFGKKPMHFFGPLGVLMFILGFAAALWLGIHKLFYVIQGVKAPLVTDSPYFYIALTSMILGTQLFMAGFIAEMVSRSSTDRNVYLIDKTF